MRVDVRVLAQFGCLGPWINDHFVLTTHPELRNLLHILFVEDGRGGGGAVRVLGPLQLTS